MGIHGLSSYANSTGGLWTKTQLKQTKVIIDGNALLWNLYLGEGIDCQCGGNYDQLANVIVCFFTCLASNEVKPFVIIDGPTVSKDKKLERIEQRFKKDVESSYNLSSGYGGREDSLLPLMAKRVFIQELENLGIPLAFCDCEADQEVASLANHWDCPVISNDSDFFIFDLPAGYIPLSSLNWNEESITGRLYKRRRLADHLQIRPEFLPLFASLVGNDFVEETTLAPFERALLSGQRGRGGKITLKIMSVANLLSTSTDLEAAMESALELVPGANQRELLKNALEESMKEYLICDLTLRGFLELGEIRTSLRTLDQEEIPSFVVKRYRKGLFPVKYIGVVISGRHLLSIQVENSNESSPHDCSRELRRIIYGIIMKPSQESQKSKTKSPEVKEWSRNRRSVKKYLVKPVFEPIDGYGELPELGNLEETDNDQRRRLLLVVLQANTNALTSLDERFQLFAASVRYWIIRATPRVNQIWVKTLLLLHLQLLDKSEEKFSQTSGHCRSDFDINCQHSLAQWQAVMLETISLNQILLDPFVAPRISTLYNGVTAQSIAREINQGKDAESFVKTADIYHQLYAAVTEGLEFELPNEEPGNDEQSVKSSEQVSTTRVRKPPPALQGNPFALLCSDESEDENES